MSIRYRALLAAVMGLLSVLMMAVWVGDREMSAAERTTLKDVCEASRDILANTVVDERLVHRVQVPSRWVQPLALPDCRQAVGRVTAVPVPRGAQVVAAALLDKGRTAASVLVPRGQRAVTIPVTEVSGVGGHLQPGNRVDILVTIVLSTQLAEGAGKSQAPEERTEVRTVWQNVPVLAVGENYRGQRPDPVNADQMRSVNDVAQSSSGGPSREMSVRHVTVLISPDGVQELVLAQQVGQLSLALRSDLDDGRVELPNLDARKLFNVELPIKSRATAFSEFHGTSP